MIEDDHYVKMGHSQIFIKTTFERTLTSSEPTFLLSRVNRSRRDGENISRSDLVVGPNSELVAGVGLQVIDFQIPRVGRDVMRIQPLPPHLLLGAIRIEPGQSSHLSSKIYDRATSRSISPHFPN